MARLKEKTIDRGPVWRATGASKMKEFNSPQYEADKLKAKPRGLRDLHTI